MPIVEREVTVPPLNTAKSRSQSRSVDWLALIVVTALVALVCWGQSTMKLFWYDELITLRIAKMPTMGEILRFYESGKDTTSFLPAMLVHVFQQLPGRAEVTTRIPFTCAYLVTCLCMWMFVRRRYPVGYAAGAVLLLAQGWTMYFASEIRAYAFVMMGASLAMVCWQAASKPGWAGKVATAGVFVGLSLAILFHVFAVFLFVPFALGEWAFARSTGRIRRGMWAALILFPATLAVMLPNVLAARRIYGKNFWSKPTIGLLTENYERFTVPFARNLAELIVLVAVFAWLGHRRSAQVGSAEAEEAKGRSEGFTRPEWVLLVAISLAPFVAFAGAQLIGVYRTQYLLYFHPGTVVLLTGALAEVLGRQTRAGWALAGTMLVMFTIHYRDRIAMGMNQLAGKPTYTLPSEYNQGWVNYLSGTTLPIVAEGSDTLALAHYYAPPQLRDRLVVLTSHELAAKNPPSITNELNMEVFGRELGYPVEDYKSFVAAHREFLLLVSPEQLPWTWMFRSLVDESVNAHDVRLTLLWGAEPGDADQVYLVQFGETR